MLHNLTLGVTYSGKSTFEKIVARGLRARGIKIAVLDPQRDDDWPADFRTHDAEKFLTHVRTRTAGHAGERWTLIIDESGSALDRYDKRFDWLATTGRHLGCVSRFIAHRFTQLSPTIRAQCPRRFIFNCDADDARTLARMHGEQLLEASKLGQGEFFLIEPMHPIRRGRVILGRRPKVEIRPAA